MGNGQLEINGKSKKEGVGRIVGEGGQPGLWLDCTNLDSIRKSSGCTSVIGRKLTYQNPQILLGMGRMCAI